MAVTGRRITVLLPGGRFQKVAVKDPVAVGQEIWLEPRSARETYGPAMAAALCLLVIGVGGGQLLAPPPAVAAFSLDFAPSVDVSLSQAGRVVAVKAFNQAGKRLLQQSSVVGLSATKAALVLTREGFDDHMLSRRSPYVLLGGVVGQGNGAWFNTVTRAEVQMVRQQNMGISVVVAETHESLSHFAHVGMSIGRYVLNTRSFSAGQPSPSLGLPAMLTRSGVLLASGTAPPA
jgi:hypothetical protein